MPEPSPGRERPCRSGSSRTFPLAHFAPARMAPKLFLEAGCTPTAELGPRHLLCLEHWFPRGLILSLSSNLCSESLSKLRGTAQHYSLSCALRCINTFDHPISFSVCHLSPFEKKGWGLGGRDYGSFCSWVYPQSLDQGLNEQCQL